MKSVDEIDGDESTRSTRSKEQRYAVKLTESSTPSAIVYDSTRRLVALSARYVVPSDLLIQFSDVGCDAFGIYKFAGDAPP